MKLVTLVPRPRPPSALRRGEIVADRGAERAGEDVGEPEGEDRVQPQAEVQHGDHHDRPGEDAERRQVAEFELLGEEVPGGGAEREGEEDGQPVEGLPAGGEDRVDRERSLDRVPACEDRDQDRAEEDRRRFQGDAVVVDQVVADQGADDADQDHGEPVDAGDVLLRPELEDEDADQQRAHDVAGAAEAEAEVFVEVVGEGLADRGAEDLDHPEVEGDLGDLVQHLVAEGLCRRRGDGPWGRLRERVHGAAE